MTKQGKYHDPVKRTEWKRNYMREYMRERRKTIRLLEELGKF